MWNSLWLSDLLILLFQALIHVMSGLSHLGSTPRLQPVHGVLLRPTRRSIGFSDLPRLTTPMPCSTWLSTWVVRMSSVTKQRFGSENLVQHAPLHGVCSRHWWWQETHQPFGKEAVDSESVQPQHRFESHQASQWSQKCWVHYQLRSSEQQTAGNHLRVFVDPTARGSRDDIHALALPGPSGLANQARSSVLARLASPQRSLALGWQASHSLSSRSEWAGQFVGCTFARPVTGKLHHKASQVGESDRLWWQSVN